jgi:formylglycine-generating enzyme required for sulfatase activity
MNNGISLVLPGLRCGFQFSTRPRFIRFFLIFFLVISSAGLCRGATNSVSHWTNSLGMIFVAVSGGDVDFCIWETRRQDYENFVNEGQWARLWPKKPEFQQGPTHPVANVSWEDAKGFCIWLTAKEQKMGLINSNEVYRLPTDLEWSMAVGLPKEQATTAEKRSQGFREYYPWGKISHDPFEKGSTRVSQVSAPPRAGNFLGSSDGFKFTAPVGQFDPNPLGIYDLGGNVWEWCIDFADDGRRHILRGGSWANLPVSSSVRDYTLPDGEIGDVGFRCVFARRPTAP